MNQLTHHNKVESIYQKLRDEVFKRELSNAENLDKAVSTYSASGLALSLTFLKDFVSYNQAVYADLLLISWAAFLCAIITTFISYFLSNCGMKVQLKLAERYYEKNDEGAFSEPNRPAQLTTIAAYLASVAFIFAVLSTTAFIYLNLKVTSMTNEFSHGQDGAPVPTIQKIEKPTNVQKGAPVPPMQAKPNPNNSTPKSPPSKQK